MSSFTQIRLTYLLSGLCTLQVQHVCSSTCNSTLTSLLLLTGIYVDGGLSLGGVLTSEIDFLFGKLGEARLLIQDILFIFVQEDLLLANLDQVPSRKLT